MRGKKITAIICSLGMLLSSVSVSGASAVTSTEKGTFFNVKTDESGRYHFEYRFDENGKKKGNDITHAAYIISTKEDVSSLKTDDTLLYSLEEIKNNNSKWYNDDHDFSDKNYDDSRFSSWKNITEYSIDEILKKYDSDYTDNLDNIYVYRSNPYLTVSERKEEAENISKKYSADYIIDMDFNQNTWAENGAKRILFELKDGTELTDELKKEILSKAGAETEINKVDLEAESKKDSVIDSPNYCINFFGNYIDKDNIYGFEVSSEDDKTAAETAEKLYDLEEVKSAFPDFDATMGRQVYYNVTLLYPNEKTLADNEELEEVPNTEDTAPATETTESATEISKENTTENVTDPTEETKITDFDSLDYPTDKDYDFHEVLEHYANDEQGNRQLVQEDIYYNFQSIYTGTYSLYERGYSYVFVTTNGKADKEELENELGKEVTAFSYYVGDKQYVYNYSKNEDYEKVYNIDGVEKVELARSKFSERCYIPVDDWGQNEWFKDNNIDPKKEKLIMADVYVENGFELDKDMFKDTGYDVVYVEKDNISSSEKNYDLWYVYFKYKGKESYTEFNKATEKIDKVHSSDISIIRNESATEGIDRYAFDIVKNPTIELPTQEITEPTKGTTATTTTTEPKEVKVGDINGDNAIDSKDAVLVLKSYADALANNKTYYEKAADVNNDGKVDSKDAVEILKTYAKNLAENKA